MLVSVLRYIKCSPDWEFSRVDQLPEFGNYLTECLNEGSRFGFPWSRSPGGRSMFRSSNKYTNHSRISENINSLRLWLLSQPDRTIEQSNQDQTSSLFGSGALTCCRTEPRQTGNRPTEENNRVAKRAKSGVKHQPAHSFSTKRSEMTMGMCVRSLFVPAQIK